jgi:hypothetical protein
MALFASATMWKYAAYETARIYNAFVWLGGGNEPNEILA